MSVEGGHGREVFATAVLAFDWCADAVLGSQVEDEIVLAGARVDARTEAADELQRETNTEWSLSRSLPNNQSETICNLSSN